MIKIVIDTNVFVSEIDNIVSKAKLVLDLRNSVKEASDKVYKQ